MASSAAWGGTFWTSTQRLSVEPGGRGEGGLVAREVSKLPLQFFYLTMFPQQRVVGTRGPTVVLTCTDGEGAKIRGVDPGQREEDGPSGHPLQLSGQQVPCSFCSGVTLFPTPYPLNPASPSSFLQDLLSRPVPCLLWTRDSEEEHPKAMWWWPRWVLLRVCLTPGCPVPIVPSTMSKCWPCSLRDDRGLRGKVSSVKPSPLLLPATGRFLRHFVPAPVAPKDNSLLGVCLCHTPCLRAPQGPTGYICVPVCRAPSPEGPLDCAEKNE